MLMIVRYVTGLDHTGSRSIIQILLTSQLRVQQNSPQYRISGGHGYGTVGAGEYGVDVCPWHLAPFRHGYSYLDSPITFFKTL